MAAEQGKVVVNPIQVQKFLKGIDYPADKSTLVERAKDQGADENVLYTLNHLDREHFNSPNDVSEAIGHMK